MVFGLYGMIVKEETHQARMCTYLSAMRIFGSCNRDSCQCSSIRMGFKRLNFDRDTRTDYWRTPNGSSSEASFRRCIWRKISNRCQVLLLPSAMSPQEILDEKNLRSADALHPCLQKCTTIPTFQQLMKSYKS